MHTLDVRFEISGAHVLKAGPYASGRGEPRQDRKVAAVALLFECRRYPGWSTRLGFLFLADLITLDSFGLPQDT